MGSVRPRRYELRAGNDLLHRPRVAVRVAEVNEPSPRLLVDCAGLDSAAGKLLAKCLDVTDHNLQPFLRARCHLGDAGSDHDRARGSRRSELHETQLLRDLMIVVEVEADLVDIESLGSVDAGNRNRDELELHVHTPSSKSRPLSLP